MYRGEYELEYTVDGKNYFIWTDAGWLDQNKEFVQEKVEVLPKRCEFAVRYNPIAPSEATALRNVRP
jgi:hypothetical protein